MRNRILRLLALGAVSSIRMATAVGQQLPFPSTLARAPAYQVPDRLLEHRTELALTTAQVTELTAKQREPAVQSLASRRESDR